MNVSFYVNLSVFLTVVLAEETKDKRQAIYDPHGQITDSRENLPVGGHNYYNNKHPLYQSPYPYNQDYYLRQPYQRYNYQFNSHPYDYQQVNPYGYQNDYNGYQSHLSPYAVRQAPPYPSPGAQPINPPVPPPFYHPPGWYYPMPITEKPTTVARPQ